ncbi:MAG TPA: DUF6714 family protein [Pyrinomonadaceae bacterium]|nr:DUF6714 family protein [Pyrinomonadaceae bacterium]
MTENDVDFERRRDALIAEITAAFDGVEREDGITLHEAQALDDWMSEAEQRAARSLDTDERWQDVPDKDIARCCSALSFLDVKGFRYYFPAFMVYALKHWDDPEDNGSILSSCFYKMISDYPASVRKSEPATIASKKNFTSAQSKAVAAFLRFVIDFYDICARRVNVEAVEKWEKFSGKVRAT